MKKGISVKLIVINAMIAGVYAALTLALSPIAYLEIQCRISEIMVFLAFYNKKYIPGLVVGCLLANVPSPLGMMDICFGTFSTLLVCLSMYKLTNRYLAAFTGAIITGTIIGVELHYAFSIPLVINIIYVFIGEFIVLVIGAIVFKLLEKNTHLMSFIKE